MKTQNDTRKKLQQRTRLKKAAMLVRLKAYLGVVAGACDDVKIERKTHYRWLEKDSKYRMAVESISERALDLAESKLMALVQDKNPQAVFFLLKTRGRKRGYIEKQEVEHIGENREPIKFKIVIEDDDQRRRYKDALNSKRPSLEANKTPDGGSDSSDR